MLHVWQSYQGIDNNLFSSKKGSTLPRTDDPLFLVMIMCKESEGVNSDPNSRFVRVVSNTNTPEPMLVLTFDWTLTDLERICVKPQKHTVLRVDPTFNLGSFHVTVTTYQHPMLEYRHQRREEAILSCLVLSSFTSGRHLLPTTSFFLS